MSGYPMLPVGVVAAWHSPMNATDVILVLVGRGGRNQGPSRAFKAKASMCVTGLSSQEILKIPRP